MRYKFAEFTLDADTETLIGPAGVPLPLRRRAFVLLRTLLEHAPALVTRDQILDQVWGHDALSPNVLPQAISEVRQALGDSAQTPRLIETRHRRGYRMLVAVEHVNPSAVDDTVDMAATQAKSAQPVETVELPHVAARPPKQTIRRWWVPAAAAVVLAAVVLMFWRNEEPTDFDNELRPVLAILAGTTAGEPTWLPDAGVEMLTVALSGDDRLQLVRGDGRGDAEGIGDSRWQLWMREVLGADYALTGIWQSDANGLSLNYSLVRLGDGRVAHSGRASDRDLATLCGQVARDLRRSLRLIDPETTWMAALPREQPAREAYYRGLSALAQGDAREAVVQLEQASADLGAGSRVRLALAGAYRQAGRLAQARTEFAKVMASDTASLSASERLRLEAEAALVADRPADAAASLRALHRLLPDDVDIALALLDVQIRARQIQAATTTLTALNTVAAGAIDDPRWHLAQARLAALKNDAPLRQSAAEQALHLADRFGRAALAVQAGLELAQAARARGDLPAARDRLQGILDAGPPDSLLPDVRMQLGSLLRDMGDFDTADQHLRDAGEAYADRGDQAGELRVRIERYIIESERGHSEDAYAELIALEPAIRELDDATLLARYFNTIGVQAVRNNRVDDADRFLQRAASESRRAQQPGQEAGAYVNLGQVLARNKREAEAAEVWEKALVVFRDIGDRMGEAITLSNLASVASIQGDLLRSRDLNQQALVLMRELQATQHVARTAFNLALLVEREGHLEDAATLFEEALAAYRAGAGRDPVMNVVAALSRVRLAQAKPDAARTLLDSVDADLPSVSNPLAKSHIATARGHLDSLTGDLQASRRHHQTSWQLRADAGLADWQWLSELDLLMLDLQTGSPAEPVRAAAERIAARLASANDQRSELQARVVEASALVRLGRRNQASVTIRNAADLLSDNPSAGIGHELDRLRILAAEDPPSTRRARLKALAADAEQAGFRTIALRCRLDSQAVGGDGDAAGDAALRADIDAQGLAGLLTPIP